MAAAVGGCSSQSSGRLVSMNAAAPSGSTVTFESIDGPPPEVFRKLVTSLNEEAGARRIAVVSRSAPATYRVRGYVSAQVEGNKTSFGWVWDVYDTDKRRALRISGEEPAAAGRRRDAWSAADEQVLRGMASKGMSQIAAFLNSPQPLPAAEPAPTLPTLVSVRDDSPEAAGIFRLFGSESQPAAKPETAAEPAPDPAAPPQAKTKKRPARTAAGSAGQVAALTPATDGRSPGR